METWNSVTFGFMDRRGKWRERKTFESIEQLIKSTGANTVILPVVVEQEKTYSTFIDWKNPNVLSDNEISEMIEFIHNQGLKVILKPMINVRDGSWRAHINFFPKDIPNEPSWSEWFQNYLVFISHYAELAQVTKCEMLVIGCELVNSDYREKEWRNVIKKIREIYGGLLTYNCNKYQESNIKWWDDLDYISSSGYYPIDCWDKEIDRISEVIEKYNKPFFFCEVGCPSRKHAKFRPNDWTLPLELSLEDQLEWYSVMFETCFKRNFISGFGIWDWKSTLYSLIEAQVDTDYSIYGKPVLSVIRKYFEKIQK